MAYVLCIGQIPAPPQDPGAIMLQVAMVIRRYRPAALAGGMGCLAVALLGWPMAQGASPPPPPSPPVLRQPMTQPVMPPKGTPVSTQSNTDETRTFTISVEQTALPPGMYGQWNVDAELVETDYPPWFPPTSNDIWILVQAGEAVMLTNPRTGAQAVIRIQEVVGNRAQFFHVGGSKSITIMERPNITVEGNQMTGDTTITQTAQTFGGRTATHTGRYRLVAQRMNVSEGRLDLRSLPTVQQSPGRLRGQTPAPNFQILPVQQGTRSTRPFGAE
jgi:hypothetical protein